MTRCLSCVVALLTATTLLAQDAKPEPAKKDAPMPEAKAAANAGEKPLVKVETSMGDFILELDPEKAPISSENFLKYVDAKYYDGTIFHRVISNFMIQGGGMKPDRTQKTEGLQAPIKNESNNGLKNLRGTISMARTPMPDSATSQFFISVVDNARLDPPAPGQPGYAVFGRVVLGMDAVDKIRDTPVGPDPRGEKSQPIEPPVLKSATRITGAERDKLLSLIKAEDEKQREIARKAKEMADKESSELVQSIKTLMEKLEGPGGTKATKTDSGLIHLVLKEGTGASPKATERVSVHYTGWTPDGREFDSSVRRGSPADFPLNQVIKGWTEGVQLMKVGGKSRFVIPGKLAYGDEGDASRPRGTLVFDVELLAIK